ncbi:cytosolic acyl coenzyme A thioester hydrolase-like isoform X2 [Dysidea avara]|uniref:cytosolic acyl coenzyme A thioester hydrolase-like isoform X2 n=1 Tax=Dysidea avara TaxID=196820 RepID=UPI0033171913
MGCSWPDRVTQGTKAMAAGETGVTGPTGNVEVSRIMLPDDANVVGNVHGGVILSMIAQAGFIVVTRHCNGAPTSDKDKPLLGVLARVEHTDFLQPMYIGELAKLQAKVTYTSAHSIEVTADVWAENLTTGEVRKTNHAILWYVAIKTPDESLHYSKTLTPVAVPPCTSLTDEEQRKGQARYEYQKQDQLNSKQTDPLVLKACDSSSAEVGTPDHSQSALVHLVLPSDCLTSGHMQGGVLMKLMDECAGIVAARHCRTNVVTISLDATNFISPVVNGELVTLRGRLTFASERSMEIAVTVQAEGMAIGSRRSTNTAYFTYVSVPKGSHQAQKIPTLKLVTEKDKIMFEDGKKRYLARKEMRKQQQK